MEKMLGCGDPDQMGYMEYRYLHCGQGQHWVSMMCKSSLCLRCAKVYVDDWASQVSKMLHDGVIYRHIVLTVPDVFRNTFYQHPKKLSLPPAGDGIRRPTSGCIWTTCSMRCCAKNGSGIC
ncbi:hypothetical protein C2W62_10955 [Candidatus Entotheonella serta]|nr:hypothetical protein C2W62_10955 [Candidatus Entotheonella serta]